MYTICSVKTNDVLNALKEAKKYNHSFPVIQFSGKKYTELENNYGTVVKSVKKVLPTAGYVINTRSLTIHTKDCSRSGENTVTARLINLRTTGLKRCKHCIK